MSKATMTLLVLTVFTFSTALAQCPNAIDTWSTTTGTMIGGRASEAWCAADGMPLAAGVPGNTQNAQSWNGSALGTQWQATGMQIDAVGAVLISDTVDGSGDGQRTYITHYTGGQFWLTRDHSWADGLADLSGALNAYQVIITITFVGNVAVGATSNITFTGTFDNCPGANECEITFTIANAMLAWRPDSGLPMPMGYPAFLCGANLGELFDICCITMQIHCAVPSEREAWGALKASYR